MQLIVDDPIISTFPELRICIVAASSINNNGHDGELNKRKEDAVERVINSIDSILATPEIGSWREAYRAFGVKPKSHRPTAEAFMRRLAKTRQFPTISKAVDSYLLAETEFYLPIGGYDLDRITGNIVLRYSAGGERFTPIGSSGSEETESGEIVYSDNKRILTRRWNYKDCDSCKIDEETSRLALFIEAPYGTVSDDSLYQAGQAIATNLTDFCGGDISTKFLRVSERRDLTIA